MTRSHTMLAVDSRGSVALMPIGTPDGNIFTAEKIALEFLSTYEHGFMQAVVTSNPRLDNWTAPMIASFIMRPLAMSNSEIEYIANWTWLLDHATPNTPEENLTAPHLIPANWVSRGSDLEDAPIFEACEEGTCFNCCDPRG